MPASTGHIEVRVLVDLYHDAAAEPGPIRIEPDNVFRTTTCRRRLRWALLRKYHLLIISGYAPNKFSAAELEDIERFIREGGGLLLASSTPRYELDVDQPAATLPYNQVARLFGYEFLAPGDCQQGPKPDRDYLMGYGRDDVAENDGAPPEGRILHKVGLGTWAPVRIPEGATPLLGHRRTSEALAAMSRHGEGRVFIMGHLAFDAGVLQHCHPLLRWLAGEAKPKPGRRVPQEIGPAMKLKKVGGVRVQHEPRVEKRLEEVLGLISRVESELRPMLGEHWRPLDEVTVVDSAAASLGWRNFPRIGVKACPWRMAYNIAFVMLTGTAYHSHIRDLLVAVFPEYSIVRHLATRIVERLGYAEEAARLRAVNQQLCDEQDPDRTKGDLARVYPWTEQWHPKGMWVLSELERRFGDGFLGRLFRVMPKEKAYEGLTDRYASYSDKAIYYLSLAAGEDLFPWFGEIGTTVHPLPIVKKDEKGFDRAVREALVRGATRGPASERLDAISDLAKLKREERKKLPPRVRRLVEPLALSDAGDRRAPDMLRSVMQRKPDSPEAAIAALQLVTMGDRSACRTLAALAKGQDYRLQLLAGHALRKAGCDDQGLSLTEIRDAQGRRVGQMDVKLHGELAVHPKMEGYEVANVISEVGYAHFPHNNHASLLMVYWVHTSPQWRRMGLSRQALAVAMNHPAAKSCSTFTLGTGTRNVAHAMYRSFGFVDMEVSERYKKTLSEGTPSAPPPGVTFRELEDKDNAQVSRWVDDYCADGFFSWHQPAWGFSPLDSAFLAEKDDKLIGVVCGSPEGRDRARLHCLCVEKGAKHRQDIALTLLELLHSKLAAEGIAVIERGNAPDDGLAPETLTRAGYSRGVSGGVGMFGIRDLGQLFTEIRPLYEKRLADGDFADWSGRVIIIGDRLKAGLEAEKGEVQVIEARARRGDLVLTSRDETITRFVVGRETPLEGYLQTFTSIEPWMNERMLKLLETLFPKVPML